ncbi:hypothetical protein BC629DRAFT_1577760 [Irpex lacteus]|nr:hypothetical protein BC629DRAFT_1577760 [Irpex lacteus]
MDRRPATGVFSSTPRPTNLATNSRSVRLPRRNGSTSRKPGLGAAQQRIPPLARRRPPQVLVGVAVEP